MSECSNEQQISDCKPVVWSAKKNHVPKEIFVREDVFEEELEKIFYSNEWILVGHESEIPDNGDFKTAKIGRTPLLINRDKNGQVNVFYNTCPHRGVQVETGTSGNKSKFLCPYHRWSFDTEGKLVGCPNRPGDFPEEFKREDYPIPRPKMAMKFGLIFASLGKNPAPIDEFLEGLDEYILEVLGGDGRLKLLGYQKVVLQANWKTYADNCTYHAGLLHTAFQMLNWSGGKGFQIANEKGHRVYIGEMTMPKSVDRLKDPTLLDFKSDVDPSRGSASVRLFPISGMTKHMDSIAIRIGNPLAVDQTEVTYAYFAHVDDDEEMVRHRVRQASNLLGPCGLVSMEDAAIFHRLHIGSNTPDDAIFLKGVKDESVIPTEFAQTDESSNLPGWEHYRQLMGHKREEA